MRHYTVVFSPEAAQQIDRLHSFIADAASPNIADRYIDALISYCEGLSTFPMRGTQRDDIFPGLRITHFRSRTVIAFKVTDDLVTVISVFHGGQDYETRLQHGLDE